VVILFEALRQIFLSRWTAQFQTEKEIELAMNQWQLALADITQEQLRAGIDACRNICEWPPVPAEFLRLAKGWKSDWEHSGPAYREVRRERLLDKRSCVERSAAAAPHLSQIRKLVS